MPRQCHANVTPLQRPCHAKMKPLHSLRMAGHRAGASPRRLLLTRFTRVCSDTGAALSEMTQAKRRADDVATTLTEFVGAVRGPLDSLSIHTRTHARTHTRTHTHKHTQTHARTHTRPSQPRLNPTDTAATAGTLLAGAWPRGGRAEARPAPIGARGGAERRAALHGVRRLGSLPQPQRRGEVRAAPTSPHDPRPTRRPPASAATCRSDRPSETVGPADRHHVSTCPLLTRFRASFHAATATRY